ncbi:hypothetical protein E2C01_011217 [Portunus trituberculatus]|uniref:Uncharacterized protein n=1 Tax=Portunus trituberculatus TaxID=210409 RepID=A0A5B7DAH6_PORTR|nr:hypothetical protein [Portunus trituberculatus]
MAEDVIQYLSTGTTRKAQYSSPLKRGLTHTPTTQVGSALGPPADRESRHVYLRASFSQTPTDVSALPLD